MTDRDRAVALLSAARTRGDIGRLAPELDEDALVWPAKRLLRVARARAAESQVRRNPIRLDESFDCGHCGRAVPAHGRTARNHCPHCLRSLHVDVVPGDRAAECGALMDPVAFELDRGVPTLRHRCRGCGHEGRVRALLDGDPPDDWEALVRVSAGEPPP